MTNLKALEIFAAQTLCDVGILLSIVAFLLHVGRPYFERILGRLPLRVAADVWWLGYVVLRDGSLFLAAVLGLWHLNLDLMADIKVGLPFVPFGTVALAAALIVKVLRNAEDVNAAYRRTTWLVLAGAVLNTMGYVLVMEAPGEEYAISSSAFWRTMESWRSNANPRLSTAVFFAAWAALLALSIPAVVRAMRLLSGEPARGSQDDEPRDGDRDVAA